MLTSTQLLPPIPQPPHDPESWLLNALTGWRDSQLENVAKDAASGALVLSINPESLVPLNDISGTFGGVTLPMNVALSTDSIYLLDLKLNQLKRFDPCACIFQIVPCLAGTGKGPRQLSTPHGIGICGSNLFICDTGNHRLTVFSLRGFVLRDHWAPPAKAKLTNAWDPYSLAFDGRGRVFVTDGANGCIHRFAPSGKWEACFQGFGKVTHIAIDCSDRIYVTSEGENSAQVIDKDGTLLNKFSSSNGITPNFPNLPFPIDVKGNLHLADFCSHKEPSCCCDQTLENNGIFDLNGNPAKNGAVMSSIVYAQNGIYITEALDSRLYRCQWHRIILQGDIPPGSRIHVSTYVAEVDQSIDHLLSLSEEIWETNQNAFEMNAKEWDCLIRSTGGRYLWLRLQFKSNGSVTPRIESIRVEYPRISLQQYLPAVFSEDPAGDRFTERFLSIFDTTIRSIETKIDNQAQYFDPMSTPVVPDPKTGIDFLSWLASWIGVVLDRHWPEEKRRLFVKRAARFYHIRGTREGMWRQLLFFLGMEPDTICCKDDQPKTQCCPRPPNCPLVKKKTCAWQPPPLILEHFQLRRWLFVGTGRLGDQAILWGKRIVNRSQLGTNAQAGQSQLISTQDPYRDPFHVYAHKFSVFVPSCFGRDEYHKRSLENLLNAEKPAHTYMQLEYVEPRFRIGFQSMIGLDSVIGRYPEGVRLNTTILGKKSMLTAPEKQFGPSFEIGKEATIGSTTKLN